MAVFISKNGLLLTNKQTLKTACAAIQICCYSDKPRIIKDPTTASLKRGTGGRSSFNGIVCTLFGNTGFIGKHLVNRLGSIGTQVILPYRGDTYDVFQKKLAGDLGQILFHPFDLRDEESIRRCIKYSNVVINCIGRDWETRNFTHNDVNVEGARRLARLSKEMGVERFIHLTCVAAQPNPPEIFIKGGSKSLKTKWLGEQAVREEFPDAVIIRLSTVYGQDDYFIYHYGGRMRQHGNKIPLWKQGKATEKQPVSIGDVVSGISKIVQNPNIKGQTYQFVGPRRYTLGDLVYWIAKCTKLGISTYDEELPELTNNISFWSEVFIVEKFCKVYPIGRMHRECIEMEHVSDIVAKGVPTLEDLGVNLTLLEDRITWEVRPLRDLVNFLSGVDTIYPHVPPPQTVPVKLVEMSA